MQPRHGRSSLEPVTSSFEPTQLAQQGAHEAAQALACLLHLPVAAYAVTNLAPGLLRETHGHDDVIVIAFDVTGGVSGRLALVMNVDVARLFAERLLGRRAKAAPWLGPASRGALSELGNIVASAFLNGVARLLHRSCLLSVPLVESAPVTSFFDTLTSDAVLRVAPLHAGDHRLSLVCAWKTT
jgi:chemotaxis protein CheY-P-specific phosphatase CheC